MENCINCTREYYNEGRTQTLKEQAHTMGFCSRWCQTAYERRAAARDHEIALLHNEEDADVQAYAKLNKLNRGEN